MFGKPCILSLFLILFNKFNSTKAPMYDSLFVIFQGFITQKSEKRPSTQDGGPSELLTYDEFHPMLFRQYQNKKFLEFESFNKVVLHILCNWAYCMN